jgi:hypothetical protein
MLDWPRNGGRIHEALQNVLGGGQDGTREVAKVHLLPASTVHAIRRVEVSIACLIILK